MATTKAPQPPKDLPLSDPAPAVEVTPVAQATPEIIFVGEGAENVQFTINPNAKRYVVNANGLVTEDL